MGLPVICVGMGTPGRDGQGLHIVAVVSQAQGHVRGDVFQGEDPVGIVDPASPRLGGDGHQQVPGGRGLHGRDEGERPERGARAQPGRGARVPAFPRVRVTGRFQELFVLFPVQMPMTIGSTLP
jgi:hypothetical protein